MGYICPICNYKGLFEPSYNSRGYGSYEICSCCGFQFGLDDYPDKEKGIKEWRNNWIKKGCPWFSKNIKLPEHWSAKRQLKRESS